MADCSDLQDIYDKLYCLGIDADKLRVFVQGDESESVLLGTVDTPTLRKLVADIIEAGNDAIENIVKEGDGAIALATEQTKIAVDAAKSSCECAASAAEAAETAVNVATSIPGFANATQAFHGLYVDDNMKLVWAKAEDGDTINAVDYRYSIVLPTEARMYLDGGKLAVHLPFTQ